MHAGDPTNELARGLAPLALAGAAAVCLWLALKMLMGLLDSGMPAANSEAPTVAAPPFQAPAESLAGWHLFGNALQTVDARSAAVIDAPETALDLTLSGIVAESDSAAGIAMIVEPDGRQAAYRVGAVLPGGARVKGVYPDHVLIVHNGRDESLRLPRERGNTASTPGASSAASSTNAPSSSPLAPNASAPVSVAGLETVDWQAVQQQIQVDPSELARQVRVLPVIENGEMVGVRLSGGANAALLSKLGLRPDDVVTAVNGISVRDTGRAQQVIAAVRDAQSARVTVRRNGREETLDVSLK